MKIKLFSHNDLDGVGAVVIGKQAFGHSLSYRCCAYSNIDSEVSKFIQSPEFETTDAIFITDISVNDPELIELINKIASDKVVLIDHHKTAEWLNEYSWANVHPTQINSAEVEELSCGTSLFYNYLVTSNLLTPTPELTDFVEQVRSWDTWDWDRSVPKNQIANQLNTLHVLIGQWKFIERFSKNPEVLFTSTEKTLLKVENKRIESTIYSKRKSMIKKELKIGETLFYVGVVFADNYHSELGNTLAKENPELDFIMLINSGNRLSFRGMHEGIDLGKVASHFGGGGHPMAAGAVLSTEVQEKMIELIVSPGSLS